MKSSLIRFAQDERGAISLDWIVLTGVLVGTGMSVVSTVSSGIETVSVDADTQLRGQIIQQSFGPENLCSAGIDGLRAREGARLAAGGSDPVNVDTWLSTYAASLSVGAVVQERDRLAGQAAGNAGWSRDHTLQGLLECRMAQLGI